MHDVGSTLRFGAPLEQARLVLILVHGRGSNPEDMIGLAESLPTGGVHFLAPAAEGGTWYPQRFLEPTEKNEPQLSAALGVIDQLVRETREAGVLTDRIGLIGFSQGACLSLEFAARHPARFAFVAALSGGLIGPFDAPRAAFDLKGTPVLIGCADHDGHIPIEYVERSADILGRSGAKLTKQIYSGYAHTIFPNEIRWLAEQIRGTVGSSVA
ncbi:MAG TPA: dienelactone hydrolase family protein [Opitutaceae bacterium]|jgi:predicted esterase